MPTSIRPGDTLADRYRLDDLLSESGSGRFWLAHDRVLQRHVALHVIGCHDERAPGLLEAARRSATVVDPRILRVLDAQMHTDLCFVVNEWGLGTSLDIALANNGPLVAPYAAWLVAEVADSVAVAHAHGVHHGRLSPENVLLDAGGGIRIIGFAVDAALHGLPPGEESCDVRDLGGLLHACLTGKWAGESCSAVPAAPREGDRVLRPRQVRAGVPRPLDDLVDELLNPESTRLRAVRDATSAAAVASLLAEFVGDPTGIAASLAAANPVRPPDAVVLDQVPELAVRVVDARPAVPADRTPVDLGARDADETQVQDDLWGDAADAPVLAPEPVAPRTPRPLFAPEPDDEEAGARAREERAARADAQADSQADAGDRLRTSDTGLTRPVGARSAQIDDAVDRVRRPGRGWLLTAAAVGLTLLLLVAVAVIWSSRASGA